MENSATTARHEVLIGFVKTTWRMNTLFGWFRLLLMWLYLGYYPQYRHVFVCVDYEECFDFSDQGILVWDFGDTKDEVLEDTDFIQITMENDPRDFAAWLDSLGLRFRWSDVFQAFLFRRVSQVMCASFVARLIGLDVPLDISPDKLYTLLRTQASFYDGKIS